MCYIMFFRMSSEHWLTSEEVPFDSTAEEALYTPLPPQVDSPDVIDLSSGSASSSSSGGSTTSPPAASVEELLKDSPPPDIELEILHVSKKRRLDFDEMDDGVPLATQHGRHHSSLEMSVKQAVGGIAGVESGASIGSFLASNKGLKVFGLL